MRTIGVAYQVLGGHAQALNHYNESLAIIKELDEKTGEIHLLSDIGGLYLQSENVSSAYTYFKEAEALYEEIPKGDTRLKSRVLGNLADHFMQQEKYPQALPYVTQVYQIANDNGDIEFSVVHGINLGIIYHELGEAIKASHYFTEAFDKIDADQKPFLFVYSVRTYANYLIDIQQPFQALEVLEKGNKIAEEYAFIDAEVEIKRLLGKSYSGFGRYEEAFELIEASNVLQDSIIKQEKVDSYAKMKVLYEVIHKEGEIKSKDGEIKKLKKSAAEQQQIWIIGTAGLVLLILLLIFKQRTSKRKYAKALAERESKLHEYKNLALRNNVDSKLIRDATNESWRKGYEIDVNALEQHIIENHRAFSSKVIKTYPDLSKKEVKICSFILLDLSSKEIANTMSLTVNTVDNYRSKIRKKIGVGAQESLLDQLKTII